MQSIFHDAWMDLGLAVCVWANSEVVENTAGEDIEEADSEVNEDDKGFDK